MNYNSLVNHPIHSRIVIDWSLHVDNGLDRGFFESIHSDPFFKPHRVNLFRINKLVYHELVREFFATFEFRATTCRNSPRLAGIQFRLGGEQRDSTQRVPVMDLFFLYCIYVERVVCNIPYWLGHYLSGVHEKRAVFGKKSLVAMEIIIELAAGECHWLGTHPTQPQQHEHANEEEEEAAKKDAGDSQRHIRA
ncbi:hypothetical protein Tco_0378311 [Tanacetum coccineum]